MKKYPLHTDEMLLALLAGEEEEAFSAFEEIYHRYWKKLYILAYRRINEYEVSEELVQDIFTSLWVKRCTVTIQTLSAYLFVAMKYKVINYIQKEMVKQSVLRLNKVPETDNSTEEIILMDDLNHALEKEISKLPDKCQQVFKLSRGNHLSTKQVALKLGISEKTVENHLSKAMKMLRMNLRHFTCLIVSILLT